jgi:hypothetical protein
MIRHLPSLLAAPCLGCLISLASAAPPDEAASPDAAPVVKKGNATSYVSLVKDRSGRPTLMINYRWKLYPATSVEVRLAAPDEAPAKVVPLFFVREYFQGDVSRKVFHCLDEAEQRETVESFLKDNMDFHIVGRRNSLGRPAVLVAPRDKVAKAPGAPPDFVPSPKAAFLLLDCWSLGDRTLSLDLPPENFTAAGLLHVWFLRSDHVLWEETLPWPGDGKKAEGGGGKAEGGAKKAVGKSP